MIHPVLNGATAALCAVAALLFAKFRRQAEEPLFLPFSAAFFLLAINYAVLGTVDVATESRPYVFLVRLAAYALILVGIIVRNRRAAPARGPARRRQAAR